MPRTRETVRLRIKKLLSKKDDLPAINDFCKAKKIKKLRLNSAAIYRLLGRFKKNKGNMLKTLNDCKNYQHLEEFASVDPEDYKEQAKWRGKINGLRKTLRNWIHENPDSKVPFEIFVRIPGKPRYRTRIEAWKKNVKAITKDWTSIIKILHDIEQDDRIQSTIIRQDGEDNFRRAKESRVINARKRNQLVVNNLEASRSIAGKMACIIIFYFYFIRLIFFYQQHLMIYSWLIFVGS